MRLVPSPLLFLAKRLSVRRRAFVGIAIVLGVAGRLAVVGTAFAVARGDTTLAFALGATVTLIFVLLRVVSTLARSGVEAELYELTARALLDTDVLVAPVADTQRIFDGLYTATELWANTLSAFMADFAVCVVVLPFVFQALSARMLVIAALALVIVIVALALVRSPTRQLEERLAAAREAVGGELVLAIEGRLEIVAGGNEAEFVARLEMLLATYKRLARRSYVATAMLGRLPIAAGVSAVVLAIAIDAASRDAIVTALFSDAVIVAGCIPPLMGFVLGAHALVRGSALIRSFVELLGTPTRSDAGSVGAPAPKLPAKLVGEKISFRYTPTSPLVLNDVGFEWSADEPLVVVGPNGSGKSTLLRLLLGLRPLDSGRLLLDGEDVATLDLRQLRRQTIYLPQRPYLGGATTSVRTAMSVTRAAVNDEAVIAALEQTGVMGALRTRAGGSDPLDVLVAELSTGQRQRVALARVLASEAALVLLDEPDANLDEGGIALVTGVIRELVKKGRMVAVAAHTPSLAEVAKRHVVLPCRDARSTEEHPV